MNSKNAPHTNSWIQLKLLLLMTVFSGAIHAQDFPGSVLIPMDDQGTRLQNTINELTQRANEVGTYDKDNAIEGLSIQRILELRDSILEDRQQISQSETSAEFSYISIKARRKREAVTLGSQLNETIVQNTAKSCPIGGDEINQDQLTLVNRIRNYTSYLFSTDLEIGNKAYDSIDEKLTRFNDKSMSCEEARTKLSEIAAHILESNAFLNEHSDMVKMQELHKAFTTERSKYLHISQSVLHRIDIYLESISSKNKLTISLWTVVAALGLTCLLVIAVVRIFPSEVQIELVVSGQVIQFITVMVVLSITLVLGLTETVKENTLGTLLGGVAGYVLAQGVGRAAASEAVRRGRAPVS